MAVCYWYVRHNRKKLKCPSLEVPLLHMPLQDLISDLKSELSGHLEEVVLGLMMTPQEYDAAAVYNAIKVSLSSCMNAKSAQLRSLLCEDRER